jgi:hypothetical protein
MARGYLRAAVGVKKAGIPAPAARIRSANVPCGQSSIAISPDRYFFSRTLLLPRYESTRRLTWPLLVSRARPPLPSCPALFDTAVRECSDSGPRLCNACIRVSVPQVSLLEPVVHTSWRDSATDLLLRRVRSPSSILSSHSAHPRQHHQRFPRAWSLSFWAHWQSRRPPWWQSRASEGLAPFRGRRSM